MRLFEDEVVLVGVDEVSDVKILLDVADGTDGIDKVCDMNFVAPDCSDNIEVKVIGSVGESATVREGSPVEPGKLVSIRTFLRLPERTSIGRADA